MSSSNTRCIPSNPDISGIGVRTAIYTQNFLSFVPAIYALLDKKVTRTELQSLETQSTTILITAFAILISTVVQALKSDLTNFHATIVLSLSWMNNTNMFIYFLLYMQHRAGELGDTKCKTSVLVHWVGHAKSALHDSSAHSVLIIGSLHLTLMAGIGIWLWSQPAKFGDLPWCGISASLVIVGSKIPFASGGLRSWSLFIYSLLLLPGLNLIIPIALFMVPYIVYGCRSLNVDNSELSITPVIIGLLILAIIDAIFLIDIETTIQKNLPLQLKGDGEWSFGQTLALLLLLVPLRDVIETFRERIQKQLDGDYCTAFHAATNQQQWNTVRYLVEKGANVNAKDERDDTALQIASYQGQQDIVELLITKGADVNSRGGSYGTALQAASSQEQLGIIQLLIQKGGDVNLKAGAYGTPLQAASYKGHLDIVKLLLDNDANINTKAGRYRTAFQAALVQEHFDIIKLLVERGADINAQAGRFGTALQAASAEGQLNLVKFLIEKGAEVNAKGGKYSTALRAASFQGHLDIARFLIEKGAEVDVIAGVYGTILQASAYQGHLDIVKLLIEKQADVNAQSGKYGTALVAASYQGHLDIVKLLIKQGADINARARKYGTACQAAFSQGHSDIVLFLVENGAVWEKS